MENALDNKDFLYHEFIKMVDKYFGIEDVTYIDSPLIKKMLLRLDEVNDAYPKLFKHYDVIRDCLKDCFGERDFSYNFMVNANKTAFSITIHDFFNDEKHTIRFPLNVFKDDWFNLLKAPANVDEIKKITDEIKTIENHMLNGAEMIIKLKTQLNELSL